MKISSDFPRRIGVAILTLGLIVLLPANSFAETYVVNGPRANASDENPGSEAAPLKTIHRAAQLAQPGDTVLVHAGVYRERVAPALGGTKERPIVYTAAAGEQVVIKGSDVWRPQWRKTSDKHPIYAGALDPTMFQKERLHPYRTRLKGMPAGQPRTLGQVFVDGLPLREVDNLQDLTATPATWLVDDGGRELTIHFPQGKESPAEQLVEVTSRQRIFAPYRRGLGFIHVKGFTMEHCANQFPERFWQSDSPQAGALGCRAGHHWLIEGNTVRFAKSIGIDCGYEGRHDLEGSQPTYPNTGYHLIRNNRVTDNGCCGIAGMRSIGTRIVGNIIQRNNWNHHIAPEIGGVKFHYFIDGVIEGNLVRDNDAHGIWLDNVYRNARVRQNVVIGNRGSAVFVELGQGPLLIDNNVLANTRPGFDKQDPRADGLCTLDASGVLFVHNLVFGSQRFGSFHRKLTDRQGAGASSIVLRNNLFIDNRAGHINLPSPGPDANDNHADHNLLSAGSPRTSLNERQQVHAGGSQNIEAESASASISPDLVLTLDLASDARLSDATPVAEVGQDFFGDPLPAHDALAGPFQRLTHGKNRLPLWRNTVQD